MQVRPHAMADSLVARLDQKLAHMAPIEIPWGGTLDWEQRQQVFAETGAMPTVRYRKSWGRRALSVWGEPWTLKPGAKAAIAIMEANLKAGWSGWDKNGDWSDQK